MSTKSIIKKLKEKGFTKWEISKRLNVHWNTVNMWEKGVFNPSAEKIEKLNKLLIN